MQEVGGEVRGVVGERDRGKLCCVDYCYQQLNSSPD